MLDLKVAYCVRNKEPVYFHNGSEYQLGRELKKWGVLKRGEPTRDWITGRTERNLNWIYPPTLPSQRQARLQLLKIIEG